MSETGGVNSTKATFKKDREVVLKNNGAYHRSIDVALVRCPRSIVDS
jgi:hypothetical protein